MKNCVLPWVLALGFALLSAGMAYQFILRGNTLTLVDQRVAVVLSAEERALVLSEMRDFLDSVREITQGVVEQDTATIVRAARAVGRESAQGVPASLMGKLPFEFKALGLKTHSAFDELALNVEQMNSVESALPELGKVLNNCVACHATYRLAITENAQGSP